MLFVLLNQIARMSPELLRHLEEILIYRRFEKGETILKYGQVCDRIYFLDSGLVRIFHWLNGKDITTWLLMENNIFISPESFFKQILSLEEIVALEVCGTWSISYAQLETICVRFPEFLIHRDHIKTDYYLRNLNKNSNIIRHSPLQKYTWLANAEPDLIRRVPVKYLYSYLDLSKATFERARDAYLRRG